MSKSYRGLAWMMALVIFVCIFVFFMYTFLHEGGHALAGMLFGQTVTDFNVNFLTFNANVGLVGDAISLTQQAVQSAAGAALPFAVWVIFMIFVPRKGSFIVETLKLLSSMVVINTLLPWIVIPILFLLGKAPADDVTHVLIYSHLQPLLLALFALVLYAGGWILFLAKISGLGNEIMLFRSPSELEMKAGIRSAVPVMAGVMAVCAVTAVTLNVQGEKNSVYKYTPPRWLRHGCPG